MIEGPVICGIDEAGRGPLAGRVYAAAVILNIDKKLDFLNDSKKLSTFEREQARKKIRQSALAWGIGFASHKEIDEINILMASLLAMKRAFNDMLTKNEKIKLLLPENKINVIIDGKFTPSKLPADKSYEALEINAPCEAIIKADTRIQEVMAASILAKTERDDYMREMALRYPQYGYEKHKGYPTKEHREAVIKFGPSPIQRLSFKVKLI